MEIHSQCWGHTSGSPTLRLPYLCRHSKGFLYVFDEHKLYNNNAFPPLFSSKSLTQKSTTIVSPRRKVKLLSYQRKPQSSNLISCCSTSRNPSSPSKGAGVLGHDLPPLTHLHFRLYTHLHLRVMRECGCNGALGHAFGCSWLTAPISI